MPGASARHPGRRYCYRCDRSADQRLQDRILVDLSAVTFIDSTGLRLLIRMTERCGDGGLEIRSTPVVDRLLQVTGLLDQLPLVRDGDG